MALGKHSHNPSGRIRKERSDSRVKNLEKEYPKGIHIIEFIGLEEKANAH